MSLGKTRIINHSLYLTLPDEDYPSRRSSRFKQADQQVW